MNNNKEIVKKFYGSFQKLDAAGMISCYADDVVFFDPVFGLLKGEEARCMWKMLCKSATDFSLTFDNIVELDDEYCTCDWVASYTFSKTGRKVINKIKANMRFINGEIAEHSDAFSLHKWSEQALGLPGKLFGWNSFFQRKIKNQAKRNLLKFIQSQAS